MKLGGKTLKEHIQASEKFIILALGLQIIIVILRLTNNSSRTIELLITILGVIIIIWAGWTMVKDYEFNLKQAGVIGFLISLATIWALPIFHSLSELIPIIVVNAILYVLLAGLGGWLAKRY
ncbi:MAG: hypothetical protein ACXACY_21845 [Candidatus Hodarchaeales archaeon]|jgi:hypothetical protein